ncbi:MAG: protein kinase, partial [Eggerthellaceae bacterium]|nr:protein kinase [Eggerthellaceae bacterium]
MNCPHCNAIQDDGAQFCSECGGALSPVANAGASSSSATNASSGTLGPYQLLGELGRGAMARVWRAFDPNLEREVAIKEPLFDPSLSGTVLDEMGRRFVAEGRAAAKLNHPGIVQIYAADVYDGRPAIVMELVDGTTLGSLLDSGRLDPPEALSVLDQLLDAVGYAHANGIVHRDIKPDNIFVDKGGRVKLADFGIAHVDDAGATRATVVGTVLGTPGYMSPEQATGSPVDGRSDLFSVGVVGYEMLAGDNPFNPDGADSTTLLYRIVHEPAAQLPDAATAGLPADLRPAIMAALSKDPANRPQTAAAFSAMLHGADA